jgi:tetratricopeptide (TPR) repeat protein
MLALDYQLMAQDGNLDQAQRQYAWQQGEQIALQAREINPYNPDNTGNMGRYYFTLGQVFNPERFQDALAFFEKATVLAPSNVIYHNLWAQTFYILQDYQNAVDRLQTSVAIDPEYSPTWILLGDTYAAMGNIDKTLEAHTEALNLYLGGSGDGFRGFSDQFFDQRLNFYISAGRGEDIITVMQQAALDRPDDPHIQWAIGHAYNLLGQPDNAIPYLEQARTLEEIQALEQGRQPRGVWNNSVKELSNIYLAQNAFDQAAPLYEAFLQQNPNDVESHSALGFIYARLGNLPKAIEHNLAVVQQLPEDYDSLKNLALLYRDNGQPQEALDFARRAQAVAPEAEAANWPALITEIENQLNGNN